MTIGTEIFGLAVNVENRVPVKWRKQFKLVAMFQLDALFNHFIGAERELKTKTGKLHFRAIQTFVVLFDPRHDYDIDARRVSAIPIVFTVPTKVIKDGINTPSL